MSEKSSSVLKPGSLVSGAALLRATDPDAPPPDSGDPPSGAVQTAAASEQTAMTLPSGRAVSVLLGADGGEQLQVRAPDGRVEVRILLTDRGPEVRLDAARLEIAAPEGVSVNCSDFTVNATGGLQLSCEEDMKMSTTKDIFMLGSVIWLN